MTTARALSQKCNKNIFGYFTTFFISFTTFLFSFILTKHAPNEWFVYLAWHFSGHLASQL